MFLFNVYGKKRVESSRDYIFIDQEMEQTGIFKLDLKIVFSSLIVSFSLTALSLRGLARQCGQQMLNPVVTLPGL